MIIGGIKSIFKNETFSLYEIRRPSKGLVHPALMLKVEKNYKLSQSKKNHALDKKCKYFTIRFFEKNDPQYQSEEYFERARFHRDRMKKLANLGRYYPKIQFIDLTLVVVVLQDFIFAPICDFITRRSVEELIDLIFIASINGLFLDFNHNHWLFDENTSHLFYVDKDFCEEYDSFEEAVYQNFNQATLFFNDKNPPFFAEIIEKYQKSGNNREKLFVKIIKAQIREKKQILDKRDPTPLIQSRLNIYNELLTYLNEEIK